MEKILALNVSTRCNITYKKKTLRGNGGRKPKPTAYEKKRFITNSITERKSLLLLL
jgi:hypothetical protein